PRVAELAEEQLLQDAEGPGDDALDALDGRLVEELRDARAPDRFELRQEAHQVGAGGDQVPHPALEHSRGDAEMELPADRAEIEPGHRARRERIDPVGGE